MKHYSAIKIHDDDTVTQGQNRQETSSVKKEEIIDDRCNKTHAT